jgi:hypothetical protein
MRIVAAISSADYVSPTKQTHIAGIAQLAEQLICNQQVIGSIPVASSTTALRFPFSYCTFVRNIPNPERTLPIHHGARGVVLNKNFIS